MDEKVQVDGGLKQMEGGSESVPSTVKDDARESATIAKDDQQDHELVKDTKNQGKGTDISEGASKSPSSTSAVPLFSRLQKAQSALTSAASDTMNKSNVDCLLLPPPQREILEENDSLEKPRQQNSGKPTQTVASQNPSALPRTAAKEDETDVAKLSKCSAPEKVSAVSKSGSTTTATSETVGNNTDVEVAKRRLHHDGNPGQKGGSSVPSDGLNKSAESSDHATNHGNSPSTIIEELLITDETLPPFDFGGHPSSAFLSKFTWASFGMASYLQSLAFTNQLVPPMQRRRHVQSLDSAKDQVPPPSKDYRQPLSRNEGGKEGKKPSMHTHKAGERPHTVPPFRRDSKGRQSSHNPQQPNFLSHAANRQPSAHSSVPSRTDPQVSQQSRRPQLGDRSRYPAQHPPAGSADPAKRPYSTKPHRHSYPAAPAAALKPIRRLAKIRPYANQAIPVSAEEIFKAIPREASPVFHVMDRRINLDAFAPSTTDRDLTIPVYSLLRAWVQDDPCRQIPPHQVSEPTTLSMEAKARRLQGLLSTSGRASALKRGRDDSSRRDEDGIHDKKRRPTSDVIGYIAKARESAPSNAKAPALPSIVMLRKQMVQNAKKKKRSAAPKQDFAQIMKRLRKRKIEQF